MESWAIYYLYLPGIPVFILLYRLWGYLFFPDKIFSGKDWFDACLIGIFLSFLGVAIILLFGIIMALGNLRNKLSGKD